MSHRCFQNGSVLEVKELLKGISESDLLEKDKHNRTVLHLACIRGNINIVKLLLTWTQSKCVKIFSTLNEKDDFGRNALHYASRRGNTLIVKLLINHPFFDSNMLLEKDISMSTVLHFACDSQSIDMVKLFLRHSICEFILNEKNNYGITILHHACQTRSVEFVKLILEHPHFDPKVFIKKENWGSNILHIACYNHKMVKLLLDHSLFESSMLIEKDYFGWTPLLCACRRNNINAFKLLLNKIQNTQPTEFNDKNDCGQHILHFACLDKKTEIVKIILQYSFCASIFNDKDYSGNTALQLARLNGYTEIVQLLEGYIYKIHTSRFTPKIMYSKVHILSNIQQRNSDIDLKGMQKMIILITALILKSEDKRQLYLDIFDYF